MNFFNKINIDFRSFILKLTKTIDNSIGESLRIKLVDIFSPLLLFCTIFFISIYNLTSIIFFYALTKTLILSHYIQNYKKNDKIYDISNDWLIYTFSLFLNKITFLFYGFFGYIIRFLSIIFIFDLLFLKQNNDKNVTMNTFIYDSLVSIFDNHYLFKNKYILNLSDQIYKLETEYYPKFRLNIFDKVCSLSSLVFSDDTDTSTENDSKKED